MPKIVDHDERRHEFVEATWRIIGRGGFQAATLQGIAAEAGFAHGIIRHYFNSKHDLLAATFWEVFTRTDARADRSVGSATGLEAARIFALELFPLDEERINEAKVVVSFWSYAETEPELSAIHNESVMRLHERMVRYLTQARERGEIHPDAPVSILADEILWVAFGAQIIPLLVPAMAQTQRQLAVLNRIFDSVRCDGTADKALADTASSSDSTLSSK